jgi:protoporphyrin/coproporphyrin ferrochelatase
MHLSLAPADKDFRMPTSYDALLFVSFGGPNGPDDVIPFLENVLRGRNVPRERLLEVAEHYYHFGGKSPINAQNQALIEALRKELDSHGIDLPIYWGNRNWHPLLADTMRQMREDGIRRALAYVTSAFSCYSGCRQYREDIARAQEAVGAGAPEIHKLRPFFNHPGFVDAMTDNARQALQAIPEDRRSATRLIFTAHSIPMSMAATCDYELQLQDISAEISSRLQQPDFRLVYQSRSGPPSQPWLEPDVVDYLGELAGAGIQDVIIIPVGFTSDHMEVLYDLDTEARQAAKDLGLNMVRAATVGTHPRLVRMIRELMEERMGDSDERASCGTLPARPDFCPENCCPPGKGRPPVSSHTD